MASTITARSQTVSTPYESARIKLIRWGALMAAIYVVYLIFFPLTPTIYRSDHILEIEQMLRNGRHWFAPLYVLGLLVLFYAFWRVRRTLSTRFRRRTRKRQSRCGFGFLASAFYAG